MSFKILVINPGSTSTKIAIFDDSDCSQASTIKHTAKDLATFDTLWAQFDWRVQIIRNFLSRAKIEVHSLDAVAGRGGLLRPLQGGTYIVNEKMLNDSRNGVQGIHVSNLGCALAHSIATTAGCQAYTVDPVSVDEFEPLARYSGHPLIQRQALSHALNLHGVGRRASELLKVDFECENFIVAHLGGGISIAPIKNGCIIDVNDASSGGPFSPERTGSLPLQPFIELCYSGKFSKSEIKTMVMGEGGLKAYLGTHDAGEVERRINQGDKEAKEVFEAMAYQIAKEIGAMSTVLRGRVKAIVITGGLSHSECLVNWVRDRVSFIAPVLTLSGEYEMEALATGVLRVLQGKEVAKKY